MVNLWPMRASKTSGKVRREALFLGMEVREIAETPAWKPFGMELGMDLYLLTRQRLMIAPSQAVALRGVTGSDAFHERARTSTMVGFPAAGTLLF